MRTRVCVCVCMYMSTPSESINLAISLPMHQSVDRCNTYVYYVYITTGLHFSAMFTATDPHRLHRDTLGEELEEPPAVVESWQGVALGLLGFSLERQKVDIKMTNPWQKLELVSKLLKTNRAWLGDFFGAALRRKRNGRTKSMKKLPFGLPNQIVDIVKWSPLLYAENAPLAHPPKTKTKRRANCRSSESKSTAFGLKGRRVPTVPTPNRPPTAAWGRIFPKPSRKWQAAAAAWLPGCRVAWLRGCVVASRGCVVAWLPRCKVPCLRPATSPHER